MPETAEQEKTSTQGPNLFEKAVLLVLSTPYGMGLKRKIKEANVKVDTGNPDIEWIEGTKKTLKSKELEAVKSADGKFKNFLESRCVVTRPGSMASVPKLFKHGIYAVPLDCFEEVDDAIEAHKIRRVDLIEEFLRTYDERCKEAKEALGNLYSDSDYPTVEWLRAKMQLSSQYIMIGAPSSLRGINSAIFKREADKAQVVWADFMEEAQDAMRVSLQELVDHAVDQLTPGPDGKKKRFYGSTVEKLDDFFATFNARNISNDTQLAGIVDNLRDITSGIDPDDLRKQEDLRIGLSAKLSEAKVVLDTMVSEKPSRMFVMEDDE